MRPRDWHPVADSDPVPGDPDQVAALGRRLRGTAGELERQIRNLKAVSGAESWDSKAGREFRQKAQKSVKKLESALKRYDSVADALGTAVTDTGGAYRNYASDLNRAQGIADAALKDAKDADERGGSADQRDAAEAEIESARKKINYAKEIRDAAAKRACEAIDAVISGDSLKDGFWDRFDDWVEDIGDWTGEIATWLGVASLMVGWIPVIGQALAGALGSLAMIFTLVSTLMTVIQFTRGDAGWADLAFAAIGFAMVGVGKGFSKIAGKFGKGALNALERAGVARTARQAARADKNLNRLSGKRPSLSPEDVWKSLKEPFTEPFSKASWSVNLKALKPGGGNYGSAWRELSVRGSGNALKGISKSLSLADPGVSSDLKSVKLGTVALAGQFNRHALNRISKEAAGMSLAGSGITLGGLGLDGNLNPFLD